MYRLATLAGAFLATLGIASLAVSGPGSLAILSTASISPPPGTADQLDRSGKGDRLSAARPSIGKVTVTTVEVVGIRDAAVVYRDRDGRVLFRTDPVANVTIVGKDVSLPDLTIREHGDTVANKMPLKTNRGGDPVKTLREGDKEKRLDGCDPLVSPLAGSSLSQVAGRCIVSIGTEAKVAMATR